MGFFDSAGGLISGNDYSARSGYASDLRNLAPSYDPYTEAGATSLKDLMGRYKTMLDDPDFLQNKLSGNWKTSDYAQNQMKYLTQAMNNNAAATGQLGSSYSANTMGTRLQDILSTDQNRYIDRAMGVYGRGISGEEGVNSMGYNALNQKNALLSGAAMQDMLQKQSNMQANSAIWGSATGLVTPAQTMKFFGFGKGTTADTTPQTEGGTFGGSQGWNGQGGTGASGSEEGGMGLGKYLGYVL